MIDCERTDKLTNHSYIPIYEQLFKDKRHSANHVLEIGIAKGGSILLWRKYFSKALIHAVDIYPQSELPSDLPKLPDVICYTNADAYSTEFLQYMYVPLDIVIDDGPHTFASQKSCIESYLPRLAKYGLLIIEDIQHWNYVQQLIDAIPPQYPCTIQVHDLRAIKNRPDDILLILQKM